MTDAVAGIGGVFFRARNPAGLARWYADHLGIELATDFTGTSFFAESGDETVWALFRADTTYFGDRRNQLMINYRVRNLDALLVRLRGAGVSVDDRVEDLDNGRFAWATDPEGNRFELWEPR
jgi:predicted enzyme related to lactoylglutathione lyase